MTKKILCCLLLLSLMLALFGCAAREAEPELTIAVATDIHYLSPSLTDGGDYFLRSIAAGDGKPVHYIDEIVHAFCRQMHDEKPDYLILSGDLSFNGTETSHGILFSLSCCHRQTDVSLWTKEQGITETVLTVFESLCPKKSCIWYRDSKHRQILRLQHPLSVIEPD